MKQLLLSAVLLFFSITIFAQATPVGELRVLNGATLFKTAIPAGTKVFNTTTGKYWVCTTGAPVGSSLDTPGLGITFVMLNPTEQSISAATDGTESKITLSNDSYTNGTKGTVSTLNIAGNKIDVSTSGTTITLKAVQALTYTQASVGHDENSIAIDNVAAPIVLKPANSSEAGLMTKAQYDKLTAISDNAGIGVYTVQTFEEDGVLNGVFTLNATPKAGSMVLVSLNGVELRSAASVVAPQTLTNPQYSVTGAVVTLAIPTVQYDVVVVTYSK